MTDDATAPPDPEQTDAVCDLVCEDTTALSALMAAGVEVDGEVQVTESTWVIYGHTSYDGETIVGEYHDAVEATEVFRAVALPRPDDDLPLP